MNAPYALLRFAYRFAALVAFAALGLSGCSTQTTEERPNYAHQPGEGLATPGDSVALAKSALQRLRSSAIVLETSSAVIEAIAANPLDYACESNDPETKLCDEFLAEPSANYAAAVNIVIDTAGAFASDLAVGIALVGDPRTVSGFLYLPNGGNTNGSMVTHEPRPLTVQSPLAWRLSGTDTQIAASPVGLLSARMSEQIYLARSGQGGITPQTARAASLLLARYAALMAQP